MMKKKKRMKNKRLEETYTISNSAPGGDTIILKPGDLIKTNVELYCKGFIVNLLPAVSIGMFLGQTSDVFLRDTYPEFNHYDVLFFDKITTLSGYNILDYTTPEEKKTKK